MTDTALRGRAAALLSLRTFAVAGALALALSGCSASTPSVDDIVPDEASAGDTGGATDESPDGEVTVIGADLASSTAVMLAETYAKGRDPIPTVEFTDATTVRFSWSEGLTEGEALSNCQIAYGVMSGEGVRVLIAVGDAEADCTAEVEG